MILISHGSLTVRVGLYLANDWCLKKKKRTLFRGHRALGFSLKNELSEFLPGL